VELADGLLFSTFAAAVIASGGVGVGVPHELLHGGNVGAGVEQIASEGTTEVVRTEGFDAGGLRSFLQDEVDGSRADADTENLAAFTDGGKERDWSVTAQSQPVG
jgi:hypothetical protein